MSLTMRAVACGLLRPLGGRHYSWCPNRHARTTFPAAAVTTRKRDPR